MTQALGSDFTLKEPVEPPFTPTALSTYLGVPLGTLADWRYRGVGPRFFKCGKLVRYSRADVAEWQTANTRQSTTVAVRGDVHA